MESHPVPQNISSYEFRLVGDMTLKQFGQLAGGVIVALVFYSLPIHPLIKWPLILFFSLLGIMLAFVPLEERPLSLWIVAFFKAVYAPTQFLWQKQPVVPEYFTITTKPVPKVEKVVSAQEVAISREKAQAYLTSLPQAAQLSGLEKAEREFLAQLNRLMTQPMIISDKATAAGKAEIKKTEKQEVRVVPVVPPKIAKRPEPVRSQGKLPEPVTMTAAGKAPTPVFGEQGQTITKAASFAPEAPIPNLPTQPNIVVGQVLDKYGRIIENAIVEIKDVKGVPMRALRSNKLGHFQIVTPLPNGKYTMETEKEGFEFDTISFETKGEVIPPISIMGKAKEGEGVVTRPPGGPVMIYR